MNFKWSESKSTLLSSILVKIVLIFLVIGIFIIPTLAKWYSPISLEDSIFIPLMVALYTALIPAFIAVLSLDKLLSNIKKEIVFVTQNVRLLRIISWCCFAASFILGYLGYYRFFAFLLCFAAGFFGIIVRVIKNVFQQAITIREENDYTI